MYIAFPFTEHFCWFYKRLNLIFYVLLIAFCDLFKDSISDKLWPYKQIGLYAQIDMTIFYFLFISVIFIFDHLC